MEERADEVLEEEARRRQHVPEAESTTKWGGAT
jgi:hypothetical protein